MLIVFLYGIRDDPYFLPLFGLCCLFNLLLPITIGRTFKEKIEKNPALTFLKLSDSWLTSRQIIACSEIFYFWLHNFSIESVTIILLLIDLLRNWKCYNEFMKIEQTKKLKDADFRRLIGVKRETFTKMLEILDDAKKKKRKRGGRQSKLCLEDRLIASLSYWREYRPYAHIAADFGIDESNIIRSVKWIEDVLIKDGTFSLPG
ncbi:MAG: transposase family protein, partial [Streptococcaceae bacterium]|nr:transposase family protein [Streptococcaceae bacterium]